METEDIDLVKISVTSQPALFYAPVLISFVLMAVKKFETGLKIELEQRKKSQTGVRSFQIDRLEVDTKSQLASAKIVATQKLNIGYKVSAASHKIN